MASVQRMALPLGIGRNVTHAQSPRMRRADHARQGAARLQHRLHLFPGLLPGVLDQRAQRISPLGGAQRLGRPSQRDALLPISMPLDLDPEHGQPFPALGIVRHDPLDPSPERGHVRRLMQKGHFLHHHVFGDVRSQQHRFPGEVQPAALAARSPAVVLSGSACSLTRLSRWLRPGSRKPTPSTNSLRGNGCSRRSFSTAGRAECALAGFRAGRRSSLA